VQPPPGTSLREGEQVTLVPSWGPPPVPVPDVTGDPLEEATNALRTAKLVAGDVRRVYSDSVAEGAVVKQSPADGRAPQGSPVDLWVSKGHAPVAVPKVMKGSQGDATATLDDAGFTTVVKTAFSNKVARGLVMDVSPAEGSTQPYGSAVTITVSLGPESFPAPTLTGLSPDAAKARAKEYGLGVSYFYIPGSAQTLVIGQNPKPGTTVRYGDTIVLYVG
jgi:beta-lactam-binding protein with PASTA domain